MEFNITLLDGKAIENFSLHEASNVARRLSYRWNFAPLLVVFPVICMAISQSASYLVRPLRKLNSFFLTFDEKTMWGDHFIRNYIFPLFLPGVTVLQSSALIERFVLIFYIYTASVFLYSLCSPAPYGRYTNAKYGWLVPSKPAWIVQESPAVFVPLLLINSVSSPGWSSGVNQILVYCFMLHYIQRSFVFPLFIRGGKPTPLSASVSAFIFCCYNGFMQIYYLLTCHRYPHSWLFQWNFVLGISMFFVGMAVNIHSDRILRNLRAPGETGYKIPNGGVFNYVSGANYTGEIAEWWGFALAAWNAPAVAFAVFTSCFLGIRAWWHHQYYLQKFGSNYPKERKIVIPYIF